LVSSETDLDTLENNIVNPIHAVKCIYLSQTGCQWNLKPIVCEMFICNEAKKKVFDSHPHTLQKWEQFIKIKKSFTWPDQPVLFEMLERRFLSKDLYSPLMYIHHSPGLLKIKKMRAGKKNNNKIIAK